MLADQLFECGLDEDIAFLLRLDTTYFLCDVTTKIIHHKFLLTTHNKPEVNCHVIHLLEQLDR